MNLVGEFAAGPLKRAPAFVIRVFFYELNLKRELLTVGDQPDGSAFNDAVKELQRVCSHQLQRLAMRSADQLMVRLFLFPYEKLLKRGTDDI